jgi:5-methylcytosine-specific restriction protein A
MPQHPCPDCGQLLRKGQRHDHRPSATERGYGPEWARLSRAIIERDRHVCQLQLPGCTGKADTTDHVIPKVRGGNDDPSNLVAACRHCNGLKSAS